jgi:hypothetical protein
MIKHSEHPTIDLPEWVKPPLRQCFARIRDESRFLHLSMKGLDHLTALPRLLEILHSVDLHAEEEAAEPASQADRLTTAKKDAEWIQREVKDGYPILHAHSVVALWSALEVLSEDLSACWLTNKPECWQYAPISKLRITLGEYEALPREERVRFVIRELARSLSVDLKTGIGRLEPLLGIFGLAPAVGPNLRRALHELSQIRNVIVHAGGRVDRRLLAECPWLPWRVDAPVIIDHTLYGWYYSGADCYAERVFNQALLSLGDRGCECPGLDEIAARPVAGESGTG